MKPPSAVSWGSFLLGLIIFPSLWFIGFFFLFLVNMEMARIPKIPPPKMLISNQRPILKVRELLLPSGEGEGEAGEVEVRVGWGGARRLILGKEDSIVKTWERKRRLFTP